VRLFVYLIKKRVKLLHRFTLWTTLEWSLEYGLTEQQQINTLPFPRIDLRSFSS
jgi:hypothetical protein